MNYLTLDVETTTGPKKDGNPFTKSNKLCLVGILDDEGYHDYDIEYSDNPYGDNLREIKRRIDRADLLIGFNIKFDLHWMRRYGISVLRNSIFDCQLAEFILLDQQLKFPSLAEVATRRELGSKLDVVSTSYWQLGIDTTGVPWDTLSAYCAQDIQLTKAIFDQQVTELKGNKKRLFWLQCKDLLILEEMEWNGLKYDTAGARREGEAAAKRIAEIDSELDSLVATPGFNFNSSYHLSCLIYGGEIKIPFREQYERILKDGTRKEHEHWAIRRHRFPSLCAPYRATENKRTIGKSDNALEGDERIYSTAEPILRRLKGNQRFRAIRTLLLERAKYEKLNSTYYNGLIEKLEYKEWGKDMIHGNFNQSAVSTGRLSSSDPNLQNFAGDIKDLFYSRYNTSAP